jgi:hypothetical protein
MRRLGVGVLLAFLACLLTAPLAQASDGKISGDVTAASSKAGIEGVEVIAYPRLEEGYEGGVDVTTNAGGDYTMELEPGEYKVEFDASGTKYASQFYKDKLSLLAAETIRVVSGNEISGIGATLYQSNTILGTVTSASSHADLGGIEVTAYEAKGRNAAVRSVETNGVGDYELTGLSQGEYVVEFRSARTAHLDYAPQYYDRKPGFHEAESFGVDEGDRDEGVDGELLQGASIAGTVTDAASHQPLADVIVYAVAANSASREELESAGSFEDIFSDLIPAEAITSASGAYTLVGLPTGSVDLEFFYSDEGEGIAYSTQIYDEKPLLEGGDTFADFLEAFRFADPVEVTAPGTATGIDAAMVRKEPADPGAPAVSGTPAAGQTLTCERGSWTGIGTLSFTQQWLRDGVAIAGATGSTYVVEAADEGHELSCEVTATNEFGKSSATSKALAVPARVSIEPGPAAPVVAVASSKITVSRDVAHVAIACADANCSGTIELTEQVLVKHRRGKKTISKKETVVLATGSYSLSAGQSGTIVLHLTAKGRSALADAKHHQLSVDALAAVTGGVTAKKSIVLSEPTAAKPKHR